jgi:cell division septum initiation protein DivIVA
VTEAQYHTLLTEIKACREDIEALRKRIEDTHDPVLQTLLEMIIQVKPTPASPIQDLLNKANKKTS